VADEDWQARWYRPASLGHPFGRPAGRLVEGLPEDSARACAGRWSTCCRRGQEDRYPKYLPLGDARLALHYRFEPGATMMA
jgi:ATP-dependent helicase HrpA